MSGAKSSFALTVTPLTIVFADALRWLPVHRRHGLGRPAVARNRRAGVYDLVA